MMTSAYPWFFQLLTWIIPVITAVSWRECAKVIISDHRGDSTANMIGLGSFSSFKNLDPIGSAISPLLLALRHKSFVYGWARASDIRANFLHRGKLDVLLIVFVGIASNYFMAVCWALIGKLSHVFIHSGPQLAHILLISAKHGVQINLTLVLIHLLPLPPLDMSYLVRAYLPRYIKALYSSLDHVGHYIIFTLIFLKLAQPILDPAYHYLAKQMFDMLRFTI